MQEDLQVSNRCDNEGSRTTSDFITELASDPHCREDPNTTINVGSNHSCDRNGVVIREAQIDGAVEKVEPTS